MSREEAVEILSDMRAEYNLFGDEEEATRYHVLSMAIQEMKAKQTERKVGKWIDEGTNYFCSECYRGCWVKSDYCPWCGARMEGEEDAE